MSLIRGDALRLPLRDESVDLIVTSPPYFALRSYTDGGEHYAGQIGSEPTPGEFIDALVSVTEECSRVLKRSGSMWVNLGDKYAGTGGANGNTGLGLADSDDATYDNRHSARNNTKQTKGFRPKTLLGLPWRYALRCIDDLGLILRAEVIWSKPNGLPESVRDRVRRSHEQWFHFTREPSYFAAVDEVRVPGPYIHDNRHERGGRRSINPDGSDGGGNTTNGHPLGALPGSVRTVATEPLRVPDHLDVDHFAAFPSEWPRWIINGWSPRGICVECGEGRRPVVDKLRANTRPIPDGMAHELAHAAVGQIDGRAFARGETSAAITGVGCGCGSWGAVSGNGHGVRDPDSTQPPPTQPAVVLDPFAGTGTTVAVANALGRTGIGLDLSADYLRVARYRCGDPKLRAKVLGVDPPKPQVPGQLGLLEAS